MYERKGNPGVDFLMFIMASGIAHHMTISQAHVHSSSRSNVFLKLTADRVLVFRLDRGLMSG